MQIDPGDIKGLINAFEQSNEHLTNMARQLDFPWNPTERDPQRLHT
jgi:hypothetical protein